MGADPLAPKPEGSRLCFAGPMMGRRRGYVTTQALCLSDHFREAGYPVIAVSASANRYVRMLDMLATVLGSRRRIDILIVEIYGGPSFVVEDAVSWLGRRFGHRIVMLLHGGAMPRFIASHPRWVARVLRRADAIVAPSPFLARAAAVHGFGCRVIPNVIDLTAYPYRPRRGLAPRLFWMRTFHPVYNPGMAIRVLARLRATHPGATLVMGGQDKGMQDEMRSLSRGLGVEGAVRFPGFLDQEGKSREGAAADIFVNTNRIDNMPVSVVEACAMGLPVVTTDVGGIRDLVADGETALLVPDDDDRAMTRSILRLLEEPDLAERLSVQGRRLAERSAWEQVFPQWRRLFEALGAGRSPAAGGGL